MKPLFLALCCWLCLGNGVARASELPHHSLRALAIDADAIVEAVPLAPLQVSPTAHWTITKVIQGDLAQGAPLETANWEFYGALDKPVPLGPREFKPIRVQKALLFLNKNQRAAAVSWRISSSGVRLLAPDGTIYRPQQQMSPGYYHFQALWKSDWDAALGEIETALVEAAKVRALRSIEGAEPRNQAILSWIETHCDDVQGRWSWDLYGAYEREPSVWQARLRQAIAEGKLTDFPVRTPDLRPEWGELGRETFDWVLQSDHLPDKVRAWRLYAELYGQTYRGSYNHKTGRSLTIEPFAHAQGRRILLELALNDKEAWALRKLALGQLDQSLWRRDNRLTPAEQSEFIAALLPLVAPWNQLSGEEKWFRRQVVQTLLTLSDDNNAESDALSGAAVARLEHLFQAEPDAESEARLERLKLRLWAATPTNQDR